MDRYGNLTDPCLSRTINAAAIRNYIIPPLEYDKPFEGKLTEVRVEPDTIPAARSRARRLFPRGSGDGSCGCGGGNGDGKALLANSSNSHA